MLADYYVMNKNNIVAKFIGGNLEIIDKDLVPLYLVNFNDLESWLLTRAIDSHRPNSRLLKKALRLKEYDDLNTVINAYALTITDNYWIRPFDVDLDYYDIRFTKDTFSSLSLTGSYDSFNEIASSKFSKPYTPELTNIGSFEKCWKLFDNTWYLCKKANEYQRVSEVFIYKLGKLIGFDMAEYKQSEQNDCIISRDFTNNAEYNFEPIHSLILDNDDYNAVYTALAQFNNPDILHQYLNLIFMDTLIANPDRHTFNMGVLRDSNTGKIIKLAPNFDNNMALISNAIPKNLQRDNDILIKLFKELLESQHISDYKIPEISLDILKEAWSNMELQNELKDFVNTFVLNGYKHLTTNDTNMSTN